MPPEPLVQSERVRASVIAVLMLAVLALSLAAAHLFAAHTRSRWELPPLQTTDLGMLHLAAPADWLRPETSAADLPAERVDTFIDPAESRRRLVIAELPVVARQSLASALNQAAHNLIAGGSGAVVESRGTRAWRQEGIAGVILSAGTVSDTEMFNHNLAVFSRDGRRYWMVYLSGPVSGMQQERFDEALITAIVESIRIQSPPEDEPPSEG